MKESYRSADQGFTFARETHCSMTRLLHRNILGDCDGELSFVALGKGGIDPALQLGVVVTIWRDAEVGQGVEMHELGRV